MFHKCASVMKNNLIIVVNNRHLDLVCVCVMSTCLSGLCYNHSKVMILGLFQEEISQRISGLIQSFHTTEYRKFSTVGTCLTQTCSV